MNMFQRTPLAWNNLTHRPRRLIVSLMGVGFGVLLMFMETGFRNALFDSTVGVVRAIKGDILIVSQARYTLTTSQAFDFSRVQMARSCVGVATATPLYIEPYFGFWREETQGSYPIRVLAFHLQDDLLDFDGITRSGRRLEIPYSALVDRKSKQQYGMPTNDSPSRRFELSGRALRVVGSFEMGTDFVNDGNLIMSAENFERFFRYRGRGAEPLTGVDIGVVRVEPGANPQEVKRSLNNLLPADVTVLTKQEFIDREIKFWEKSTPVGFIFLVGTIMGFLIGAIICYQVIYSLNEDYMSEFATLKAMGYQPAFFIRLVVLQSLYLSILAFIPGFAVSWLLFRFVSHATGLLMAFNIERVAVVLALTVAMCLLAGTLAMRKVLAGDPAELF